MSEIHNSQTSQIYLKCKKCLQIEPQTEWLKSLVCKHCNHANQVESWPSSEITEFISLSLFYFSNGVGENPLLNLLMGELASNVESLKGETQPTCFTGGQPLTEAHLQEIMDSLTKEGLHLGNQFRINGEMREAGNNKLKIFSIILCCLVAEMILEEHLFVLAWTNHLYEESDHIISALFQGYQGRSGRLLFFKRMEGGSYKNLCESLGYGKMYDDWERVTQVRNSLLHGDISKELEGKTSSISLETLKGIFDGLLEVSRLDQNDYTSKFSYIYKYAVEKQK